MGTIGDLFNLHLNTIILLRFSCTLYKLTDVRLPVLASNKVAQPKSRIYSRPKPYSIGTAKVRRGDLDNSHIV